MSKARKDSIKWKKTLIEVFCILIVTLFIVLLQFSVIKEVIPWMVCVFVAVIVVTLVLENKNRISHRGKSIIKYALYFVGCLFILMNDEASSPLRIAFLDADDNEVGDMLINESDIVDGEEPYIISEKYLLHKGSYFIDITYSAEEKGNLVELYEDGKYTNAFELDPQDVEKKVSFVLEEDTHNVQIKIIYAGKGCLQIENCMLTTDNVYGFYSDNLFFLFLFMISFIAGVIISNQQICFDKEKTKLLFILFVAAVFVTHPMYSTNLTDVDDIMYHMLRIEGIKDGILDGQIPVIIMPKALQGNGYLNCMYPYLFLYIPALMRICRVSLVLSYKVLIFVANFATVGIAYYSIKSVKESKYVALLGALLYLMMPYRYFCIYQRGALGEVLALTFMPLLLAGLYHIMIGDKNKWFILVLGFTGVIQSHILSFVFFLMITAVFVLMYVKELFTEKRIGYLLKAAVVSIGLNLWFIVPFLTHLIRDNLQIKALRISSFTEDAINPSLLAMTVNMDSRYYLSYGIPILCCFTICLIYMLFIKNSKECSRRDNFFSVLFAIACLMGIFITGYSASGKFMNIKIFRKAFEMIQFPWRLLAPTSIIFIFIGVIWLSECDFLMMKNVKYALFIFLVGINMFTVINYEPVSRYAYKGDYIDYSIGHETKVKGYVREKVYIGYPLEWRVNGVGNSRIAVDMKLSDVGVNVVSYKKDDTDISFVYSTKLTDGYVDFPLMGYYGYQVKDENDEDIVFELANEHAIRVPLNGDGQVHTVAISYTMPWIYHVAVIMSLLSTILFVLYLCYYTKRKRVTEV